MLQIRGVQFGRFVGRAEGFRVEAPRRAQHHQILPELRFQNVFEGQHAGGGRN